MLLKWINEIKMAYNYAVYFPIALLRNAKKSPICHVGRPLWIPPTKEKQDHPKTANR
jgi:hypothetical protein